MARSWNYWLSLLNKHKLSCEAAKQIHSHLIINSSHYQFNEIFSKLWNAILRHYSLASFPREAITLFKQLQLHNCPAITFDSFGYSFLIKACTSLQQPALGSQLHSLTFKVGFESHVYVQTSLVNMYVVCGHLIQAQKVFDEMPKKNIATWNVLITGLMNWGKPTLARTLFDQMPSPNVISWTGIIDGYTRMGRHMEAMSLFRKMVLGGIKPNEVTILAIFPAIWNTGCLFSCQLIHAHVEKTGDKESDIRVANSIIDAYSKCGCLESGLRVFETISTERQNVVSWSSIISGLAMHGMGKEAVDKFRMMENTCTKPNPVTFLSILSACSHGGLVEEGLDIFEKMVVDYGLVPDIKHYGCMIDMLGRAGKLEEAEKIALRVPEGIGNVVIWRTLLGACNFHGNVEVGERVMRRLLEMERGYGADYVLLHNMLVGVDRYADAEGVRVIMNARNATKAAGMSSV